MAGDIKYEIIEEILEDCQRQVNVEKKIDINRHINFTMRGIETYDII